MARLENAKVKSSSGAYDRLFGIPALGKLISRVQSAVISSGSELERIILARVERIADLDKFLQQEIMRDGVLIASKKQIKKCQSIDFPGAEPDFLIFKRRGGRQRCHVVELKDGHQFDTKKASAERRAIHSFIERNGQRLPYVISAHFCCFNQDSQDAIVAGFKGKINKDEAMTGRQFCKLLEIDYDDIVQERKREQPANVHFFLRELVKIDEVRTILRELMRNRDD